MAQVTALGMDKSKWRGIVVAGENWHGGVVGIVASRIVDKYHRPTIVIAVEDDKAMGSCRSVAGFDICKALQGCDDCLLEYGGHAMAAGLKIEPGQIDRLREAFNQYANEHLSAEDMVSKLEVDAEVAPGDLDVATVEMIERLGPFGAGNPTVRLVSRGLRLMGRPQRIGKKGDHLAFTVITSGPGAGGSQGSSAMRAVAFGKAKWDKKLIDAEGFDAVFEPSINRFGGNTTVEMIVRDVKIAD